MTGPTVQSLIGDAQRSLADAVALATDRDARLQQAEQQVAASAATIADLRARLATAQPTTPALPLGWTQVTFFDDFNGPLDTSVWKVLDRQALKRDQAWLSASQVAVKDGCLVVTAANLPTPIGGRTVTSGALSTLGAKAQRGGRFEICAALPTAPALWSAGWLRDPPAAGELDIFEAVGLLSPIVQTAHQDTSGTLDHLGFDWKPPAGWSRSDFHVYGLEWDADKGTVRWDVDGQVTRTVGPSTIGYPSGKAATWLTGAAYSQPMAILLNLQVGGGMSAYYGNQTVDPAQLDGSSRAQLRVKWVRMLQR